MVLGYQAREFGLGLGDLLTNKVLKKVNDRMENKDYISVKDVKLVRGNNTKNGKPMNK